ncbi:unnamed protein product [Lactuca virosa]|uniref:Replication factor A C-terminal domain-containing protein n=1 Tax=Lactuca virosa TaxID=75947 RepID=A0AAU9MYC4_9ASTR|nr:unnamed protein product [Lactuca virosa]
MAARNITFISDLDNMRDDYTLKGTKIRASVYRKDFQRFDSKLKEDDAIYIRSPTIAPNKYTFKISDVTSKLNLHGQTTVHECLGFQSKTKYEFCFVSFETIISATTTSNISIDVIGEVVSLGKLDSRDVSKSKHRLTLQIRNLEGLQVNVTLFADFAYQVISYLEAHKQVGRVVIILQFARLNVYNGIPSVNNYFDHTRMFINADLPEIVAFTDSLVGLRGIQNPSSSLTFDSSQSYNEYEDFLNNHKVKNVVDLLEPQEVGKFIIVGTIYGIRQDIDWYYDACSNCGKKVDRRDVFSGPDSGDASVVVECSTDKYKIPIRVQDDSGTITLTLFDRDAYRLVKQRASELIEKIKQAGNSGNPDDTEIASHEASHETKSLKILTINMDVYKTNKKIKLNNFYLDNTKHIPMYTTSVDQILSSTNVSNPGANGVVHRSKNVSASTSSANVSKKSMLPNHPSHLNVRTPLSNISNVMDISNNSFQSPSTNISFDSNETFKGVVNRNKNVCTSMSNGKMSKQPMLQTPSYLNFRTPLSNISNVMDISNNSFQTPLPNIGMDSNDKINGVVRRNKNITSSESTANMSKQSILQNPPSHLNVRTPLSNISNAMDISKNSFQSPLPNIRQYSVISNGDTSNNSSTVTKRSSSVMSTNPNRNKNKKRANLSPIPIIGLTSDQDNNDGQSNQNIYNGISKDYLDHGDQNVVCQTCFAKLWKDESIKCRKKDNENYSLCCGYGKVELPELKNAPPSYEILFKSGDSKSKHFMKNIRSYNSMFSFTSMGGKIDSSINRGNAPYIFRLSGQNYHSIGSLLPNQGFKPKFSQLYIYDTDNEIANRRTCLGGENQRSTSNSSVLDDDIIQDLKLMLDSNNVLVQSYRMVRDCFNENPCADIKLRIIGRRDQDGRTYNLPSASEVAALIVGDIGDSIDNRDIVVQTSSELTYHIEVLHLQATASGPTVQ